MNPSYKAKRRQRSNRSFPPAWVRLQTFAFMLIVFSIIGVPHILAETKNQSSLNCRIHQGTCTQDLTGCTVSLDINPKPVRAMKDLTFTVQLAGEKPASPPLYRSWDARYEHGAQSHLSQRDGRRPLQGGGPDC